MLTSAKALTNAERNLLYLFSASLMLCISTYLELRQYWSLKDKIQNLKIFITLLYKYSFSLSVRNSSVFRCPFCGTIVLFAKNLSFPAVLSPFPLLTKEEIQMTENHFLKNVQILNCQKMQITTTLRVCLND